MSTTKRCAGAQAGVQECALAMACLEQIHADSHVGIEVPLLVEGRFAGTLYSSEDHGFHEAIIGDRTRTCSRSAPAVNANF